MDPVMGWGLGGWIRNVPVYQQQLNVWPTKEVWAQAHSEPVQWLCEMGVVGALLLGCWLYTNRAVFYGAGPWSAATAAFAANALVFFPAHQVALALVGIIVVALAQASLTPEPVAGG
jgi:O-antigen ligase